MVGPGAAASAAAEERWRKLQEYLAAKGKLKDPNAKPYLKAKNICSKPPSSKSTAGPKKDVSNRDVLPVKTTRPVNIKFQTKPANITGSRRPELEPPKPAGKGLTSRCFPSNTDCKQSSKSQQQHKAGSSTIGGLSRKPRRSPDTQELKTKKQQEANQGNIKCTEPVTNTHMDNQSLDGFLDEMNKENLPHTLLEAKKTDPDLRTISKPDTGSYNQTQRSLAPKQVLNKSSVNRTVLKDRANKQFVRHTQIRAQPVRSQQLSTAADSARPREKPTRTDPSHFIPAHNKTQTSKKPGVKDTQDTKVKHGRPNETTLQSYPATEQKVKPTKTSLHLNLLQGGHNNRHRNTKQDQKTMQPDLGPRTSCILQKSKALNQRPNLTAGKFNSAIPSTPSIRTNKTHNSKCNNIFQQKPQTMDSKFKKVLPQSHSLNKTAPRTQAGTATTSKKGAPSATQTHPRVKKTEAEDRRKQLEEWQKSKGKTYKRPPMELKKKRKVIEKMNVSFWKSIEREEEEKKAQLELCSRINNTLTECLRLFEEGVHPDEIFPILSGIPEAEKFAKFWVCKAKLLASKGTFDATGLYKEAIKNGAAPMQELWEVLNISQDPSRSTEAITSDSLAAETNIRSVEEPAKKEESGQSSLSVTERDQVTATPRIATAKLENPGIKLQIAPIPRICGLPEVQDMKLITPVRRSERIERAVARYPEMLQDHDVIVASFNELLEVEKTECFVFRENEALPVTLGFEILES